MVKKFKFKLEPDFKQALIGINALNKTTAQYVLYMGYNNITLYEYVYSYILFVDKVKVKVKDKVKVKVKVKVKFNIIGDNVCLNELYV